MKQLNSHTNDIDCYSTTIYSFTNILLLWKLWKNKHSFIIVFPHMCFMNVNFQVRRWWMHRMLDLFRMNVTHNTNQLCKFANTLLLPQYCVRGVDNIQKCLTTTAYQYIIRIRLSVHQLSSANRFLAFAFKYRTRLDRTWTNYAGNSFANQWWCANNDSK